MQVDNKQLRIRNLDIIRSIRRHLQKDKGNSSLYYVPKFEKAIILCAINQLEKIYYSKDYEETALLNKKIGQSINTILQEDEKKDYVNPLNQILIEGVIHTVNDRRCLRVEWNELVDDKNFSSRPFEVFLSSNKWNDVPEDVPVRVTGWLKGDGSIGVWGISVINKSKE